MDIEQDLLFALWLSQPGLLSGPGSAPVFKVEDLKSVSELQCEVGRMGALPLGQGPLIIPLKELFTRECSLCVTCHLLYRLTKYTLVGTAFGPFSTTECR